MISSKQRTLRVHDDRRVKPNAVFSVHDKVAPPTLHDVALHLRAKRAVVIRALKPAIHLTALHIIKLAVETESLQETQSRDFCRVQSACREAHSLLATPAITDKQPEHQGPVISEVVVAVAAAENALTVRSLRK